MTPLIVTAAILIHENRILITRRSGGSLDGYWEFPGGKLEPHESMQECLAREIEEELGVQITVGEQFCESLYQYPAFKINLTAFLATLKSGSPQLTVHDKLAWVTPAQLADYQFAPADVPIVEKIRSEFNGI